ncbi:NAD(P)/FAD-dependent oxidoreductase [Robertkochia aurantiaca]|uniref:NAD(P)/FAD-dependent oxidoreductase n=1 Tax=Robertkochia aurantiaca TaxID=2873700 RepID=UPI001CCAA475|nr:FAD/NAD(P)-binding oxidoreductase [Robertkochia sp. 3YJGBD-33]
MKHIVIIGNGISGVTAARHIRKQKDYRITLISSESQYFFSRTALMYIYMGHMTYENTKPYEDWFWKKNRLELLFAHVEKVDTDTKTLHLDTGDNVTYDRLIIACGSKPNRFGWPGQDLEGVQGLYSKQDLEMLERNAPNNKQCPHAVIIGGGLIGIELAEMLSTRKIPVTFLVREKNFWGNILPPEDAALIEEHIREHHIDLRLSTELKEIEADENGRCRAVITNTGERIECQLVGLTAGVSPNIDFLKDSKIELGRGVKVNRYLETNIADVFAIGDCAEQTETSGKRRPIEAVWYTGRMMGEVVAQTICGRRTPYQPGHWFNSAKFFDIEYQTYGWVWPEPSENEKQLFWKHPSGKKAIRLAYDKNTKHLLGLNSFGIRIRHEVIDQWLTEKRKLSYVIENFKEALFEPEFFGTYKEDLRMIKNQFATV